MDKALFYQHIAQTSPESIGMEVNHAKGIWLYGPEGQKWIDFISGICVNNVGHGVPEVLLAIIEQTTKYLHPMVYGEVIMTPQVQYGNRLVEMLDNQLDQVYFTTSGAEAVEGALKIAKKYTGKEELIGCWDAYHGSTHAALSVGGSKALPKGYGPLLPKVSHIRFNHEADLSQITQNTAAVIIEAIQGAGGIVLPETGYLQAVRARCNQTGALLILDEIQTGFGRTGSLFAHQEWGFEPDILLLAKALGGGMPLGAFIARGEIMKVIQKDPVLGHITTFGGHPVSCAAGLATLNYILDQKLMDSIPSKEAILRARLSHPAIKELRGKGLLFAVIFEDYAFTERVRQAAFDRGLLTIGFINIDNGLRIAPPLTITEEELHLSCDLLLDAIASVQQ